MTEPLAGELRSIEVDLRGLREFAAQMRKDLDESMRPVGDGIVVDHATGVPFGWGLQASGAVVAAQAAYRSCLTAGSEALSSYLDTAETLLAGALAVAQRYENADDFAAAKSAGVHGPAAVPQVRSTRPGLPGDGATAI